MAKFSAPVILHHVAAGDPANPPVVLLGSIASTTDMWSQQIAALAKDFYVIALDHRGHGNSPLPPALPGITTIADVAADVLATLGALGIGEFALCGLSLGGAVAQFLAAHFPRIRCVALLCTASYFGGAKKWQARAATARTAGLTPFIDTFLDVWIAPKFQSSHPDVRAKAKAMIAGIDGQAYAQCADALASWNFSDQLPRITAPVLTLAGKDDPSTSPEVVHAIAAAVSGPASTITVAGAHVPTLESPDQVSSALREFLSRDFPS